MKCRPRAHYCRSAAIARFSKAIAQLASCIDCWGWDPVTFSTARKGRNPPKDEVARVSLGLHPQ